ncbi:TetR/AcrR family transcriptional regulator [Streptomyces olivoreticuli]|uniref:TetR/AcrR family transcriptional regulator n=1 Tax=Streptomyces olivoreticuli TaxID=68246 RepID=UPI000E244CCF|nr:TetR/AcrR family transcriptional regulator [Streptomyces olivoreticuli]
MSDRRMLILKAATHRIALSGVRGLRVEEVAAQAGVSTGLVYYHFRNRTELLRCTLDFICRRAEHYTAPDVGLAPRAQLEHMLLSELQDTPEAIENSTAWGELQASAAFDPSLCEQLRDAADLWNEDLARLIKEAQAAGTASKDIDVPAAAERLSSLADGLSGRWLSGVTPLERARTLLRGAIARELDPVSRTHSTGSSRG